MPAIEKRYSARETARAYEATLPAEQRKLLGQFFTGMPLGKLLAHLALDSSTKTVLDPMAGHGDLLDATWEAAETRHIIIERSDGIEVDERTASVCRERLTEIIGTHSHTPQRIISGNSFAIDVMAQLPDEGYDLVITNPPYVRYQARKGFSLSNDKVRTALGDIVNDRVPSLEKDTWQGLVMGYSGLADLSVPCWLLSGLLVRPGGRLALVAPATWRSRDYADLIQYLLLRCFNVEYVVEDTHPGWFNDALIRTHLIVAKRLPSDTSVKPLRERSAFSLAEWVQIAPEAADGVSLVGRAFEGESPEAASLVGSTENPRVSATAYSVTFSIQRKNWNHWKAAPGRKTGFNGSKAWTPNHGFSLRATPHDFPYFPMQFRISCPAISRRCALSKILESVSGKDFAQDVTSSST